MEKETIVEPNSHIFKIQQQYMEELVRILPNAQIEAVGGMAVPMVGRPELDILVISQDIERDTKKIEEVGFNHRGFADNISYLKKVVEGIDVTVQIMLENNKMIGIHRKVIDLLRRDGVLRKKYEEFKRTLSGLERYKYKEKKVAWMKENILSKLD